MPYLHWPIGYASVPTVPTTPPSADAETYTLEDLMLDILSRVGKQKEQYGITILSAANSVQSMLYKKLLGRKSDILATGDLSLNISAYGLSATLPPDFLAMAERPASRDLFTDWMAGTVVSYDTATGVLVVSVSLYSGSDALADWRIASAATPSNPSVVLGTSTTSLTVSDGTKTLEATTGMSIEAGDYIFIIPADLPESWARRVHYLEPNYLTEDDSDYDVSWWEWYSHYGDSLESPSIRPRSFKVIHTVMYVRPTVFTNVLITGRYFAKPATFTELADTIPWGGLFYEVFKEGVVRIIQKGISIPEADPDFALFLRREFDSLINTRIALPKSQRIKKSVWL